MSLMCCSTNVSKPIQCFGFVATDYAKARARIIARAVAGAADFVMAFDMFADVGERDD